MNVTEYILKQIIGETDQQIKMTERIKAMQSNRSDSESAFCRLLLCDAIYVFN